MAVLRLGILGLLLAFSMSLAQAQQIGPADGAAIRGVIQDQVEAFRRDDSHRAFGLASPSIQSMFRTPEVFLDAVRHNYAPVYRPRQFEFRELRTVEGSVVQQVYVVGPDNQPKLALYLMERQPDGSWRIAGCVLLDFEGQSV